MLPSVLRTSAPRLACWCCLAFAVAVLAVGCTRRSSVEHVEISGQVLYQGKPLPGGRLNFVTAEGGFASSGNIDEKGNYTISAPTGSVMISVDNRMLNPQSRAPKEAPRKGAGRPDAGDPNPVKGTYKQIPSKYYAPDTSGLTYTVTKGETTHNIELN
jgi:hypothetical protein